MALLSPTEKKSDENPGELRRSDKILFPSVDRLLSSMLFITPLSFLGIH